MKWITAKKNVLKNRGAWLQCFPSQFANWYLLSNSRSPVHQIQLTKGKRILPWHECGTSNNHCKQTTRFPGVCLFLFSWQKTEGLDGENLKSWRPKQQTSFFEKTQGRHTAANTQLSITQTHTHTHKHSHPTFLYCTPPHTHIHAGSQKHTWELSVCGHPLGSPVCRSFYVGNIIAIQLRSFLLYHLAHD